MRLRLIVPIALAILLSGVVPARAQTTTAPPLVPTVPGAPPAKAWILVDADSGAVIDGGNDRIAIPAASVFKLFTALLTVESLKPGSDVPISARAESMPARKINVKTGQVWKSGDLLHALLLVSANDAAVALAERIGGTQAGFAAVMKHTARALGLADRPVLMDPAGLDDEFSYQGGNRISARDLAIVTRAAMSYPEILQIVTLPDYRFQGGDGNQHRLLNHNRLLKTYPGAIGMKTGYTRKAGRCLIAAARHGNRTLIAVVLGAADTYGSASALLDKGFATPQAAMADFDHLPEVVIGPGPIAPQEVGGPTRRTTPETLHRKTAKASATSAAAVPWYEEGDQRSAAVAIIGGVPAILLLLRRRRRRNGSVPLEGI